MLQIRKVAKHVYEKIFVQDVDRDIDEDEMTRVRLREKKKTDRRNIFFSALLFFIFCW